MTGQGSSSAGPCRARCIVAETRLEKNGGRVETTAVELEKLGMKARRGRMKCHLLCGDGLSTWTVLLLANPLIGCHGAAQKSTAVKWRKFIAVNAEPLQSQSRHRPIRQSATVPLGSLSATNARSTIWNTWERGDCDPRLARLEIGLSPTAQLGPVTGRMGKWILHIPDRGRHGNLSRYRSAGRWSRAPVLFISWSLSSCSPFDFHRYSFPAILTLLHTLDI